jgi:hypothetical protein
MPVLSANVHEQLVGAHAMKESSGKKHYPLATEDQARMKRLAEEIDGRTAELGLILARQVGVSTLSPILEYKLTIPKATSADIVVVMHEVTFTDGSKLCHDGEKRVTCAGPCPC